MRYGLDPGVSFHDDGRVVIGGDPIRLLRLTDAGARVVRSWAIAGATADPGADDAAGGLLGRMVDASMMHPVPVGAERSAEPVSVRQMSAVDVVVPVRDRVDELRRCLAALRACPGCAVTVVDDGSVDAAAHREVARTFGAALVRREIAGGPAAARMAGLAATRGPLVVFVDSDVEVTGDWLAPLVALFEDPLVALAAPRVLHATGAGAAGRGGDARGTRADRFDAARSPLDLGTRRGPIRPGTRIPYVPAAAMVVRRSAVEAVGGFDETMVVGEDVDLVWRLVESGRRCRYEPSVTVVHAGRSSWGPLLRRRFDYGRSAAALDRRHPGWVAPVAGSPWSFGVVGLAVTGHPVAALATAVWTWRTLAAKLGRFDGSVGTAAQMVGRGHVGVARQWARALVRPWLPATVVALVAARSRRAATAAVIGVLAGPVGDWLVDRPDLDPLSWLTACLLDDVAYSAGVWWGCAQTRRAGPLAPRWRGRERAR